MSDRSFTIVCCVISFLFSLLASAIAYKAKDITTIKREKYFNFYYPFYTLWDSIEPSPVFFPLSFFTGKINKARHILYRGFALW